MRSGSTLENGGSGGVMPEWLERQASMEPCTNFT